MAENEETNEKKNNFNPIVIVIALIVVVAIGGYFFLSGNQSVTEDTLPAITDTTSDTETSATDEADAMEGDAMMEEGSTIEVEGGAFYFEPNEIRVSEGDTVTIKFTNAGGTHDFVLDEFGVQSDLTQTGETTEVTFVASQAGEYEFYCSVANHREQGMVGTLIVE